MFRLVAELDFICWPRDCHRVGVVMGADTVYTDSLGRFVFDEAPPGPRTIHVADDYPQRWKKEHADGGVSVFCMHWMDPEEECGWINIPTLWPSYSFDSVAVTVEAGVSLSRDIGSSWALVHFGVYLLRDREEGWSRPLPGITLEARFDSVGPVVTKVTDADGRYYFRAPLCGEIQSFTDCQPPYWIRWVDPGGLPYRCVRPNEWRIMYHGGWAFCVPAGASDYPDMSIPLRDPSRRPVFGRPAKRVPERPSRADAREDPRLD
jgi:hypothetical protein